MMPPDAPSEETDFGMTDLEETLRGPDGASVRADLVERLDAAMKRVQAEMMDGVPPYLYEPARRIYTALATAHGLMSQQPR